MVARNFGSPRTGTAGTELAIYLSCGEEGRPGKVYQLDQQGVVLGVLPLAQSATGMVLHRGSALVLAVPGDGGNLLRVDHTGKQSAILTDHRQLVHPIDVGMAGNSDTLLVADNVADVLAATDTAGRTPEVVQCFRDQKWSFQAMSVAATNDRHMVFGVSGHDGVYRFAGDDATASRPPLLPMYGGVAADPGSLRWAAAQKPDLIHVFQGEELVRKCRLPPGKELYRDGILAFAPGANLVVAGKTGSEPTGEVWLLQFGADRPGDATLFRWDKEPILDMAVGPRMPWDRPTSRSSKSVY